MKTRPDDDRPARVARAALEASRAARTEADLRLRELEHTNRLQEAQSRQQREEVRAREAQVARDVKGYGPSKESDA